MRRLRATSDDEGFEGRVKRHDGSDHGFICDMDLGTYLIQINDALTAENGANLAYLLRPTGPHGKDLVRLFRNVNVSEKYRYLNCLID